MKLRLLLFVHLAFSVVSASGQDNLIEPPFKLVDGYGPFMPGFDYVHRQDSLRDDSYSKTYRVLKGIPGTWQQTKQGVLWLDKYQYIYQQVKAGNLSDELYQVLQNTWRWTPDSKALSDKPIKCFVFVVAGTDPTGKRLGIIDTNNNLDFSDEQPMELPTLMNTYGVHSYTANVREFTYEYYQHGRIIPTRAKLALWRDADNIICNFPYYALASLPGQADGDQIVVVPEGFGNPVFLNSTAIVLNDSLRKAKSTASFNKKILTKQMSKENEYITLNQITYQYCGVDMAKKVVRLKPVARDDSLYSTQPGYKAHPFKTLEFSSRKPISLADYRGKYVFLDFWGTWCKPCLSQMPALKEAYAVLSRNDIEFIGIVANDEPENLKAYLVKAGISWPQVMSDTDNKLIETYRIYSYPTTILIDPQGRVVKTGIQANDLIGDMRRYLEHSKR